MKPDAYPSGPPDAHPRRRPQPGTEEPVAAIDVHDMQLTAVVLARQIDELTRALNYATRAAGPRLEYAADVYEVLGSLHAALTKIPQACGQLADFLRRQDAAGSLRSERGFPHAGHPTVAVEAATFKLGQAAVAANVTATAFGRAQEAISGLSHAEPDQPPTRRARPSRRATTADHVAPDRGQLIEP